MLYVTAWRQHQVPISILSQRDYLSEAASWPHLYIIPMPNHFLDDTIRSEYNWFKIYSRPGFHMNYKTDNDTLGIQFETSTSPSPLFTTSHTPLVHHVCRTTYRRLSGVMLLYVTLNYILEKKRNGWQSAMLIYSHLYISHIQVILVKWHVTFFTQFHEAWSICNIV